MAQRIWLQAYRPNLIWAEKMLGERLTFPDHDHGANAPIPKRDKSKIPMGDHCYDYDWQSKDYKPCRYFKYTRYGSVKCVYMGIEAADGIGRKLQKHYGSRAKTEAAGVLNTYTLPDSIKECGVNMLYPSTLEALKESVNGYAKALSCRVYPQWTKPYPQQATHQELLLRNIAQERYYLWEKLCSMVEDVPKDVIEKIRLLDALYRGHSTHTDTIIDSSYQYFDDGQRLNSMQFWYWYRTEFDNIDPRSYDVCWLKRGENSLTEYLKSSGEY